MSSLHSPAPFPAVLAVLWPSRAPIESSGIRLSSRYQLVSSLLTESMFTSWGSYSGKHLIMGLNSCQSLSLYISTVWKRGVFLSSGLRLVGFEGTQHLLEGAQCLAGSDLCRSVPWDSGQHSLEGTVLPLSSVGLSSIGNESAQQILGIVHCFLGLASGTWPFPWRKVNSATRAKMHMTAVF